MILSLHRSIAFALTSVCLWSCAASQPDAAKVIPETPQVPGATQTNEDLPAATDGPSSIAKTGKPGKATPLQKYRRTVMREIAAKFDAEKAEGDPDVKIIIARDGKLLGAEVVERSDAISDEEALRAVRACKFNPLPDWVEGESTEFRIRFRRVRQIKAQH